MVLETMTHKEVVAELKHDFGELKRVTERRATNVTKFIFKNKIKKKRMFTLNFKSKRHNDYLLITYGAMNKELGTFIFNKHHSDKGMRLCAIGVNILSPSKNAEDFSKPSFQFYNYHYWVRYRERMNLGEDLSFDELVERWCRSNSMHVSVPTETLDEENKVVQIENFINEGMELGIDFQDDFIQIFNTFISLDLLKGEQPDKYIEHRKMTEHIKNVMFPTGNESYTSL